MKKYEAALVRGECEHGSKFDPSCLTKKFIPWFNDGSRIRVRHPIFGVKFGTVGKTTGWRPAFLLMQRSTAKGSSVVLDDTWTITGTAPANGAHRRYTPVPKEVNAPR